jgi:DNA polymerase-3 subunit gamma/tau
VGGTDAPKANTSQVASSAPPPPQKQAELSQQALEIAWKAFANQRLAETNNANENVVLNRAVKLEGTTIQLALENQLQEGDLTTMKGPLLEYLRRYFDEPALSLSHRIMEADDAQRRPYTPQEKLNYLAAKNPAVKALQERLGLDVNF